MAGEDSTKSLLFTSEHFNPDGAFSSDQLLEVSSGARIFNNLKEYTDSLQDSASFRSLNWFPSELGIVPRPFDGPACLGHQSKDGENEGDDVHRRSVKRKAQSPPVSLEPRDDELPSATGITDTNLRSKLKKLSNAASQRNTAPIQGARRSDDRSEKLRSLMIGDIESNEGKGKQKRVRPNVLMRMEECQQGPMSILYNCMNKGIKLKVWTRRYKGLRGVCVGYLIAFDKHMNLAMIDVDEIYTIEVRTLSFEEQAEIKKQKRTAKRNRNRLNRINREINNIDNQDAGLSVLESDRSNVPKVALEASEGLEIQKIIKKKDISKKIKGKPDEASAGKENKELFLENDDGNIVSDHCRSQREQSGIRSSDSENMGKGSQEKGDSRHRKKAKLKKDSKSHHSDTVELPSPETASEIDRMSRRHKGRRKSASRPHIYESGKEDSDIAEASKDSRRRIRSRKSSKKERENSRERDEKKHHTSKKHRKSREDKRQSESQLSLETDEALLREKTVSEDTQGPTKDLNKGFIANDISRQLKDNVSRNEDKGPLCQDNEENNQTKGCFASCTDKGEDTEKNAKREIDDRVSESVLAGRNDGAIDINLLHEMTIDVVEKPTLDTAFEGITTPSNIDSDFNVSESNDEQTSKEDDHVTDSDDDDDDYSDNVSSGCLKGLHDFAKELSLAGNDEEKDKDIKCKARDKDHNGQLFQGDKSPKYAEENPVLSSELEGVENYQRNVALELREETLSSNIMDSAENSKSKQAEERSKFTNQLTTDKQVSESKNRPSKESTRCNFMLFSGQKSRKSKLKPEELLSVRVKTVKEPLKPDRRCTFSLFSNLTKRELTDSHDPAKIPQRLLKSRPEDLLRRTEKHPISRESDDKDVSTEGSVEMKSEEIDKCIRNLDTNALIEASVSNRQLSYSYDTEFGSRSLGQSLTNFATKGAESTTELTLTSPILEPQSAIDDSKSDLSDTYDHDDIDSDKGNDTTTHSDHDSIAKDDKRLDNCVSRDNSDKRESDHVSTNSDDAMKQGDHDSSNMVDIRPSNRVLDDSGDNRESDHDSNGDGTRPRRCISIKSGDNRESDHVFSAADDTTKQGDHDSSNMVDIRPSNRNLDDSGDNRESDHVSTNSDDAMKQGDHDSSNMVDIRPGNRVLDDSGDNRESDHDSNGDDTRPRHCISSKSDDNRESDHVFSATDDTTKQGDHDSSNVVDIRPDNRILDDSGDNRESNHVSSDNTKQVHHDFIDIDDKRPDNCFPNESDKNRESDYDSSHDDDTRQGSHVASENYDNRDNDHNSNNNDDARLDNCISNVSVANRESDHDSSNIHDNRTDTCISKDTGDHRESGLDSNDRDERPANCVSIDSSNKKEKDPDSNDGDHWNHDSDDDLAIVSNQIEVAIKGNSNDPLPCPLPLKIIDNEIIKRDVAPTHGYSSSFDLEGQSLITIVEHNRGRNTVTDVHENSPIRKIKYELIKLELGIPKGYEEMEASQFSSSNDPRLNLKDPRVRKMIERKKFCAENLDAAKVGLRRKTKDNEDAPHALDGAATEFHHKDVENRELMLYGPKPSEMSEGALIESQTKSKVATRPIDPRTRRPNNREQKKMLTENETKDTIKEGVIEFKVHDTRGDLLTDGACGTKQTTTKEGIVSVTKSKVSDPRLRDPRLRRYSYHGEKQSSHAKHVANRSKSTENMEIVDEDAIRNVISENLNDKKIEFRGNSAQDRTSTDESCGVKMLDDILWKLAVTKRSKIGQSGIVSQITVKGVSDTADAEHDQGPRLLPDIKSKPLSEQDESEKLDQCSDVLGERDAGKAGNVNSHNFTGDETTLNVALQGVLAVDSDGDDETVEALHADKLFDSVERKDYRVTSSTEYSRGNKQGDNVKGQYHYDIQNNTEPNNETAQYQNYDESNCIAMEDETPVWEPQPIMAIYRNENANKGTQRRKFDLPTVSATFDPLRPIPGHVFRRRHVNQLFIRGDNIALVAYDKVE